MASLASKFTGNTVADTEYIMAIMSEFEYEDGELLKDSESLGVTISPRDAYGTGPITPSVQLSSSGLALSLVPAKAHHLATTGGDTPVEADLAAAKTSVWWDIENCEVPKGCDANRIAQNIRSVLLKSNYTGPLTINAYGDTSLIPFSVQQALSSTGVSLNHVPAGVKDGSDKKILVDMMLWAMDNPAPANIMLISGDRDYSYALHKLGMRRYNILLARPEKASEPLIAAAKKVWLWTSSATVDLPNRSIDDSARDHLYSDGSEVVSYVVPKQAQPRKRKYSDAVQGSCRILCELCNVSCWSDGLTTHISGRKHRTKALLVARKRPYLRRNSNVTKSVWCGVCKMSFQSEALYEDHILGSSHQDELEDQAEYSQKRLCAAP
ncbi:unnamed protein product [Microthlaspi erraticum]|uniref:C2H2-type domain-containing protein n=1 Tax=Microthlaspi erraticum TaxID=1685480 RepID=A0A6D2IB22_9BRAS|nr:unnamed protein product [Microthlaspi erraticum]